MVLTGSGRVRVKQLLVQTDLPHSAESLPFLQPTALSQLTPLPMNRFPFSNVCAPFISVIL
jgi:hypothetical protein